MVWLMRAIPALLVLLSLLGTASAQRQAPPPDTAASADVKSLDAIIAATYDVISGPIGQKRNWDRMRSLFLPEALLTATWVNPKGQGRHVVVNLDKYISLSEPLMMKEGFFEREIGRHVDQFGNIVQVFSAYESRHAPGDKKPFERGINSFQMVFDGTRWWVLSILWQGETDKLPIPRKWLKGPQ
jgi:hypothetical protein